MSDRGRGEEEEEDIIGVDVDDPEDPEVNDPEVNDPEVDPEAASDGFERQSDPGADDEDGRFDENPGEDEEPEGVEVEMTPDDIEGNPPPPNERVSDEREIDATVDPEEEEPERVVEEETGQQGGDDGEKPEVEPTEEDKVVAKLMKEDAEANEDEEEDETMTRPGIQEKPLEDGEDDTKKKVIICLGVVLLFIIMLIALIVAFTVDPGAAINRVTDTNFTPAPTVATETPTVPDTESPTESPTVGTVTPTGEDDTPIPTVSPTESPPTTFPTTRPPTPGNGVSDKPCDLIRQEENVTALNFGENNFKLYERPNGLEICGDTFGGPDPERPNRNHWAVRYGRRDCVKRGYDEGTDLCVLIGARRCTLDELTDGVAQGTGCGGDREFVYTGTPCQTDGGDDGIYMFDFGLRDSKQPFFKCESDLSTPSIIRCCGDDYEA